MSSFQSSYMVRGICCILQEMDTGYKCLFRFHDKTGQLVARGLRSFSGFILCSSARPFRRTRKASSEATLQRETKDI